MDLKTVLLHLVKAGRDAMHIEKTLKDIGYNETPYFNLYGEICDAIYALLDEKTDTFDESETYAAMHDIFTSDEMCAERLASICNPSVEVQESNIPDATKEILIESAQAKGMELNQFINLILSEWAMKQIMTNTFT